MSQQLITVESAAPSEYTTAQLDIIKKTVATDCNDAEFGLFIEVCKSSGLNPFARQIYAIKRSGKLTIQTGIDGYRVMAERSGKYAGQIGPLWCGEDGAWLDVWLASTPPIACKVGILRRDFAEPLWAVARYSAYAQEGSSTWKKMPDVMIAKCAEALALRKAFPEQIRGVYTAEEMEQADNPTTAYVEAASAPAQRDWDAARDADVVKALRTLRYTRNNEQYDYLTALRQQFDDEGLPWTRDSVMGYLRGEWQKQRDAEKRAAATPAIPADLTELPVGERGM
ncbi:MAG TPA: phage recombination protein Bet [Ktedonobacterales bacterium]|nr:phage recombination protein Bet [Ktedonobacterales bacterium]